MTILAISHNPRPGNIIQKLEGDLSRISAVLKSDAPTNFSTITWPSPIEMKELIQVIQQLSLTITKATEKKNIHRLLRHFLFLLSEHKENMWPSATRTRARTDLAPLDDFIRDLSNDIGVVPRLNSQVVLADKKFLPTLLDTSTRRKWRIQACPNPHRGPAVSRHEIHFIGLPREALEEEFAEQAIKYIDVETGRLYLNLIDFDYYNVGLLHADHFLASSVLIQRLQEMIEAMNYDPEFAKRMITSPFNDGYFIEDIDGKIVGSYWLYMAYHNSIQNLWLLLASDNSGEGKGASDPIEWLQTTEIGKKYLRHLESERKVINKSDILYCVSPEAGCSISLKDSFTAWAGNSQKSLIQTYQSAAQFYHNLREDINASGQHSRKELIKTRSLIVASHVGMFSSRKRSISAISDDSNVSFPSINTGSSDSFMAGLSKSAGSDKKLIKINKARKIRIRELAEEENEKRTSAKKINSKV